MSRASDAWPHPHRCPHGPDGADLPPGLARAPVGARAREGRPLRRACGGQRPRAAASLQAPCQDLTFFDIFHLPKEGSSPYLKFVRNWSVWSAACSGPWARVPPDSMRGSFLCAPEGATAWRSSRVPSLRGSSLTGRCPKRRQPPPPVCPAGTTREGVAPRVALLSLRLLPGSVTGGGERAPGGICLGRCWRHTWALSPERSAPET